MNKTATANPSSEMRPDTGIGSFAYANRDTLPGGQPSFYERSPPVGRSFEFARDPLIAAQHKDVQKSEARRRFDAMRTQSASSMIAREQPKPVLRPPPSLAKGADRAAFNARWSDERLRARKERYAKGPSTTDKKDETQQPIVPALKVNFLDAEYRAAFIKGRKAEAARTRPSQSR